MSDSIHVAVICEGPTERIFVESILVPHFQNIGIFIVPILLTKKGQKGGDVRFDLMCNDLEKFLHQRHNRCVTTFFDFYGLKGIWPGYDEAKMKLIPDKKYSTISLSVKEEVVKRFKHLAQDRFIPYFSMHEIEALYFSCPDTLTKHLSIDLEKIHAILAECGEPEAINHHAQTSPSHRIKNLLNSGQFNKITTGVAIAVEIGLQKMRNQCPVFGRWISAIELLSKQRNSQ